MSKIYTIKLQFAAFCDEIDFTDEQVAPLLAKKDRILEIITDSLYGFDILSHYFKEDTFGATITPNGKFDFVDESVKEYIKRNYGDSATDTWMESDISIGSLNEDGDIAGEDEDQFFLHTIELELTLKSIKSGDHLAKKRKKNIE